MRLKGPRPAGSPLFLTFGFSWATWWAMADASSPCPLLFLHRTLSCERAGRSCPRQGPHPQPRPCRRQPALCQCRLTVALPRVLSSEGAKGAPGPATRACPLAPTLVPVPSPTPQHPQTAHPTQARGRESTGPGVCSGRDRRSDNTPSPASHLSLPGPCSGRLRQDVPRARRQGPLAVRKLAPREATTMQGGAAGTAHSTGPHY